MIFLIHIQDAPVPSTQLDDRLMRVEAIEGLDGMGVGEDRKARYYYARPYPIRNTVMNMLKVYGIIFEFPGDGSTWRIFHVCQANKSLGKKYS